MSNNYKVVIVGAGISGLTIGCILAKRGLDVTILEKESDVGGLARSFKYEGLTYDYGPHGFFETKGRVGQFIKDILGEELLIVPKKSGVFIMGEYYDWPLKPAVIMKLPWKIKLKVLLDLIYKKHYEGASLRDYLLNKYGRTLYEIDFKPYTKKFLNVDPTYIDPDWMKIGLKRAGAGEQLKMDSLWQLSVSVFQKKIESFLYPNGGVMKFPHALAKSITEAGGKIVENANVVAIETDKNEIISVSTEKENIRADCFVWTAPITILEKIFFGDTPSQGKLDYLSMVFYNVAVNEKTTTEYRWCYFVDEDVVFPRCSVSNLFCSENAPDNKTALTVEMPCIKGDAVWNNPRKHLKAIIHDLKKVKLISDAENVGNVYVEKTEHAYPIYRVGYREKVNDLSHKLMGGCSNLVLAGRQGTFWYCNMDHCVDQGMEIAQNIIESQNLAR